MSSRSSSRSDGNKKRPAGDNINSSGGNHQADGKALKEEKRRRWLAKQEKKSFQDGKDKQREEWFRCNAHFAKHVSLKDVEQIIMDEAAKIDPKMMMDKDDGLLALLLQPYRNIQDKKEQKVELDKNETCPQEQERYFIAEGTETVRLLIQHQQQSTNSRLPPLVLKSVFIKTTAFFEHPVLLQKDVEAEICTKDGEGSETNKGPPFSVLVGSEEVQSKVVGFPFCRGALACGVVPSWSEDEQWLWKYLKSHSRFQQNQNNKATIEKQPQPTMRIVALDGVCDTANLGSVVRSASAFGVDAMILSHDCCDVWYRKAVRVSMGHVARVPCVRVASISKTIERLQEELEVVAFAAVIADDNCVLEHLGREDVSGAWCCVIGNEGNGISKEVAQTCKKRLRIAMEDGVDSLSVPVAAGILLHGLKERENRGYS